MPWVRFIENFDWQPQGAPWMKAFYKGTVKLVTRAQAEEAIRKGKAVKFEPKPRRERRDAVR